MDEFIYNALASVFGGGLTGAVSKWMTELFTALQNIMKNGMMDTAMNLFAVIACSLLILYFYQDLAAQASRDMITLEKLVSAFVKMILAFALLICLKDIIIMLVDMGEALFIWMKDDSVKNVFSATATGELKFKFGSGAATDYFPAYDDVKSEFEDQYGGITKTAKNIGLALNLLIPSILTWIIKLVGYFVCTSNAVMLLIKSVFSPVAVVQCFEDGTKSAGIRYLKSLAADAITMGVMIVILYLCSALTSSLLANVYTKIGTLTFDNVKEVVNWENMLYLIVPNLAAIGAMIGAGKVAKEIVGA